jgi:SAM-dependent methyltransferase
VLPLLPAAPASVIDIGAGTGRDAAWLAERGYRVVAVEPTEALRSRAIALHPSPAIEWIDDSLPALRARRRAAQALRSGDADGGVDAPRRGGAPRRDGERRRAGRARGLLVMTLRHGPVPSGRIMFAVSAEETIALAEAHGLRLALDVHAESSQAENRDAGVSWTQLAFRRA